MIRTPFSWMLNISGGNRASLPVQTQLMGILMGNIPPPISAFSSSHQFLPQGGISIFGGPKKEIYQLMLGKENCCDRSFI